MIRTFARWTVSLYCLVCIASCNNNSGSEELIAINREWEAAEGSHLKDNEEAYLNISENWLFLYGPHPNPQQDCLDKLEFGLNKGEANTHTLYNPQFPDQQFVLAVTKESDGMIRFHVSNDESNFYVIAQKQSFDERKLTLCTQ